MTLRAAVRALSSSVALMALVGVAVSCDPVESDAIDALGGENPSVRRGPLHRPGQPCLLCHDGAVGDPPAFSVAGTVYDDPVELDGEDNATLELTDSTGSSYTAMTNAAGNFYVTPDEWTPVFPLVGIAVYAFGAGAPVKMQSEAGRSGGCATCHVPPTGPSSPGPVVITLAGGAAPP